MSKNKFYFSHDGGARNDDKIIAVRMRHKAEGYAVYFMILEKLLESTNYMSVKDYNVLAFDFRVSADVVKSVIEEFGLFEFTEDGKFFFSKGFSERMEPLENMKTSKSISGIKGNLVRHGHLSKDEIEKMTNEEILEFENSRKNSQNSRNAKQNSRKTVAERQVCDANFSHNRIDNNIYNKSTNVDYINNSENQNFNFSKIREVWENFSGKRNSFEKDLKKFLEKAEGLEIDFEKLNFESKNAEDIYFQSWLNQQFPKSSKKVAQKKVSFSKEDFKNKLLELGAELNHVEDWIKVRVSKKATFTETALNAFLNECNKNNFPIAEAVKLCAERSWQGFKYQWILNENQRNGTAITNTNFASSESKQPYFFDRERAMQALTGQTAGGLSEN